MLVMILEKRGSMKKMLNVNTLNLSRVWLQQELLCRCQKLGVIGRLDKKGKSVNITRSFVCQKGDLHVGHFEFK